MKYILSIVFTLILSSTTFAAGKTIPYEIAGEAFEGYMVSPSKKAPLVLLIHDWDGLTDYEVKRSEMLADLGYAVFAADLYGKDVRPTARADKKRITGELYKDRARMRSLLEGALSAAKAKGFDTSNAVAIGYCFGGTAVLELARSGADLKAFVTFHGGLGIPEGQDYSKTRGEVLVFHGSADSAVTMDDFADLARALEEKKVRHEMISYSGAPHAFTIFGSKRYHEEADRKSWARFVDYLAHLFARNGVEHVN